jgi:hypothetical protein
MARISSRALLIGCDFYFPGPKNVDDNPISFPHLRGAVQDVHDVEAFLCKIGVSKENIVKLTASYDIGHPLCPTEDDQSNWPTHSNIVRELQYIAELSEPGALVYIQFSGHGIQRGRVSKDKVSSEGDTLLGAALATTDVLETNGRYLTANELGIRIQAMVEKKGLRVTLVLDACFSGRGLRNTTGYTVRTIPDYHDDRDLSNDKVAENAAREHSVSTSGTRQAEVTENWLSKPFGCTVLTACGIQQTAGEGTFGVMGEKSKVMRGVLTHWMLDFLSKRQTPSLPSYTAVKEYVQNQIKATLPDTRQTPVLYGDAEYEFFGAKRHVRRPNCRVIETWDNMVRLDIGSAQGVAIGATYDIYPKDIDFEEIQNFELAREVRIVQADDFSSVAELADNNASEGLVCSRVTEGGSGVLRTWALRKTVLVRFAPNEAEMKDLLKAELEKTPNLTLDNGASGQEDLIVNISQDEKFEVLERSSMTLNSAKLQRLPVIAVDTHLAIQKLAYVLQHVSRYREIKELLYLPRTPYIQEEKFEVLFYRGSERLKANDRDGIERYEVTEGEELGLRLKYGGPAEFVWVAIFELNPSWGIVRKFASKLVKETLEPERFSQPHGFRTRIPTKSSTSDSNDTSDTFMVFIVEGEDEISWDDIMLDNLPADADLLRKDSSVKTFFRSRSEWAVRQVKQKRRWGVMSFVVHSFPAGI